MLRIARRLTALAAAIFLVAACSLALGPPGDPELVDGINSANEQALVLFASVADGSRQSEYAAMATQYDQVIGKFDALRLRAASRDTPTTAFDLAASVGLLQNLQKICPDDPADCVNASPKALKAIAENLADMRSEHASVGLETDIVGLFKNEYEGFVQQALTVEMALVR